MERTRKPQPQPGIFPASQLKRKKHGMYADSSRAGSDIEEFVIPALQKIGFKVRIIQGKEFSKGLKIKEHEDYPQQNPRILLKGAGLFLEVWSKENPEYRIVFKPFVIDQTKPKFLGNRPRWNLNKELYDYIMGIAPGIRVRILHNMLYLLDLHFIIVTKTGQFWAGRFVDMKKEVYYLTYRNDPKHLDRLAVKAGEQTAQFHSISKQFRETMLTIMYYFNKNNTYKKDES